MWKIRRAKDDKKAIVGGYPKNWMGSPNTRER
jgi:hypothetical protein